MKSKGNIVFLGMMGSGKTSIGLLISKKLKLKFFDIDKCIEDDLGINISEIFKKKGEKFFRTIEEKMTLNILKKDKVIISLGGGSFLNKNVRNEILDNHLSFWLKWNHEILIRRIKSNKKRPLAFKATNAELMDLIKKRSNIYSKAMYKINCDNLSKTEIIDDILKYL